MTSKLDHVIVIPAYDGLEGGLMSLLLSGGGRYKFHVERGVSDVPRVRSELLSVAMEKAHRVILIDSDVCPTNDQLDTLISSPLVTEDSALFGFYTLKNRRTFSVEVPAGAPMPKLGTDQVFKIKRGGLGFAAFHSESLRKIAARMPAIAAPRPWHPFCVPMVRVQPDSTAEYLPDDLSLCHRATAAGIQLLARADLLVAHHFKMPVMKPDMPAVPVQ